jgi:hypothetical protein
MLESHSLAFVLQTAGDILSALPLREQAPWPGRAYRGAGVSPAKSGGQDSRAPGVRRITGISEVGQCSEVDVLTTNDMNHTNPSAAHAGWPILAAARVGSR